MERYIGPGRQRILAVSAVVIVILVALFREGALVAHSGRENMAAAAGVSGDAAAGTLVGSIPTVRDPGEALKRSYQRPRSVPFPEDNGYTPERDLLGRMLFFDTRLSGSNWISCASCHNPALSWYDGLPRAIGHGMKQLGRRTPTIVDLAWAQAYFWDGRAATLEEQALGPIAAPGEMNLPHDEMIRKLESIRGYRPYFDRAYPGEPLSKETVARAIATFERTVVSGEAPFDRWAAGDEEAISAEAKRGFDLFNTRARCSACHSGWRFTDDSFHDIGLPGEDLGRGQILPGIEPVQHAFKTPTLRNVDLRAPYMHDGSEPTLEAVLELYDMGGRIRRASLSHEMKPLHLSAADKRDIIAFLRTLTAPTDPVQIPTLPR